MQLQHLHNKKWFTVLFHLLIWYKATYFLQVSFYMPIYPSTCRCLPNQSSLDVHCFKWHYTFPKFCLGEVGCNFFTLLLGIKVLAKSWLLTLHICTVFIHRVFLLVQIPFFFSRKKCQWVDRLLQVQLMAK